ncbi:unnamed protein product, partial [Amoebophrya sp. A120]|eukprot:GSA120T00012263001.1
MLRTDWHIQLPRSTPMLAGTQPQSCCSEPLKTNAVDDVVPRIKNKCSSCSLALLKNKAKPWPCSSKGKRICYHERDETIRRQACLMQRYIQISDFCGDGEHVCNAVCYRQDHYYPHSIEPLNFGEWESFTNPSLAARFDDVQEEEYDSVPEELSALVLQYESPLQHRVRDSEEVVRRCVQLDGLALEHASPRLRQNKEIVKAAVAQNHDALLFAGTNLRQDPEFIVQLMEDTCAEVFWNADKEGVQGILLQGQARPDLSLRALLVYPSLLKFLSSEMADYPGIAEKVLQLDGKILEFLPPAFRSDRHFVKIAMKSGGLLHHAPETLQSDAALIREMLLSHSAQLDVEPTTPPYEDKRFLKTYWPYTIDNPCNDLELLEAALRLGIANHEHIHPLVADVPSIVHLTLPKLRNSVGLVYPGKVPKGLDEIPQVMRNDPFVQREFYVETVTRSRRNLDRDVILAGIKSENPMFCADFFFNMNL